MYKKIILLFSIALAIGACQDIEKSEKPEDLISEDKMVDIITEISLLQSARNVSKRTFENTGIDGQQYIFEKYNIDSVQFKRSNDYYAYNYETYQRIYDSVKEGFLRLKVKLDTLQKQEQRLKDSLAEVKRDSLQKLRDSLGPDAKREFKKISNSIMDDEDSLDRMLIDSLPEPMSRNQ